MSTPVAAARLPALVGYYGFALNGWMIVLIPALIRAIEHDFRLGDAAFGLYYLLTGVAYAAGAFGSGALCERAGRMAVLLLGVGALGMGLAAMIAAPLWPLFMVAAIVVNGGQGVVDGGINGLFLALFQGSGGGALSRLHLAASAGSLLAPLVVAAVLTAGVSWRVVVVLTAVAVLPLLGLVRVARLPHGQHTRGSATAAPVTGEEYSAIPFMGLALGIGLVVAAQVSVSNWLMRLLGNVPATTASLILSLFWVGMALGRLLAARIVERVDYTRFTIGCLALGSTALIAAVLIPWLPLAACLFVAAGVGYGPVYPMIMALGGQLYPRRLAAVGAGLAGAAVAGSLLYPPLMGLLSGRIGLHNGMIGAALLGVPAGLGVALARSARRTTPQVQRQG